MQLYKKKDIICKATVFKMKLSLTYLHIVTGRQDGNYKPRVNFICFQDKKELQIYIEALDDFFPRHFETEILESRRTQ